MSEFVLLFHEILVKSNLLQSLTSSKLMNHIKTSIRHEIPESGGLIFDDNVKSILDSAQQRVNAFEKPTANVTLHNLMVNEIVNQKEITKCHGKCLERYCK